VVDRWTSYREFWFATDSAVIQDAERTKLVEVAAYINANPSLMIGIDASMDPRGSERSDQSLRDRRIKAIRDGLVQAGVSSQRISAGAFGDAELRQDRRVEVLFATTH
jgi:outer membrane protein OmpA-like peptidoglycan-associated protein